MNKNLTDAYCKNMTVYVYTNEALLSELNTIWQQHTAETIVEQCDLC